MNTLSKEHHETLQVCMAIQKIGKATVDEIYDKLYKEGVDIKKKRIEKITTNLQKKGICSLNYDNESGYVKKAYSMSKGIFVRGADIPIAHYKDIVDTDDPLAKELIDKLEQKKGTNKGRLPDHRDYYNVFVEFEVLDKVLGFMPFKEVGFNQHYRSGEEVFFLPQHFRAWFSHNLRLINKSESLKNYIGFDRGYVKMNGEMQIVEFPILDGNQGRGINKYEVIPAGSKIKTSFSVPKSDFSAEEFKNFLLLICARPIRGFGGRSITGFGRLGISDFRA